MWWCVGEDIEIVFQCLTLSSVACSGWGGGGLVTPPPLPIHVNNPGGGLKLDHFIQSSSSAPLAIILLCLFQRGSRRNELNDWSLHFID